MELKDFAEDNRLRTRRDEDGSMIIRGREGHIYFHGPGRLGVVVFDQTPRKWTSRKRACLGAGMELHQDGDYEGTCLFDPADPVQVAVATRVAGVKRKRELSPAHFQAFVDGGTSTRFRPTTGLEPLLGNQNRRGDTDGALEKGSDLSALSFSGGEGQEAA